MIVAGTAAAVLPTVRASLDCAAELLDTDLLVVPYIVEGGEGEAAALVQEAHAHLAWPARGAAWQDVIREELQVAREQGLAVDASQDNAAQAIIIVIKKNGRVGKRGFTPPGEPLAWSSLIADVRNRQNLGMDVTNI